MASKLSLYNDALLLCGEPALATLGEDVEGRRLLDQVWNNGGVDACLSEGLWYFAMRSQMIDYDPDEAPQFGYTYAFTVPSDWMVTAALCSDEFFDNPIIEYTMENGYIYCDITPIYLKYVSNDSQQYGGDIGNWPVLFKEFVAAHFARQIVMSVTKDADRRESVKDEYRRRKHDAKSSSLMAQAPIDMPAGSWQRARQGRHFRERGNLKGPLIGG